MVKEPLIRWLLIVTGSTLRAEEMDHPLGYYVKQCIEESRLQATTSGQSGLEDYCVRIVADFRWIHDEPLQSLPIILLGGLSVNALAHCWLQNVPVAIAFSECCFIQTVPDLAEPRASIWGIDNASIGIAVSVFVDRFLRRFLNCCTTASTHLSSLNSDGETGTGTNTDHDDDENNILQISTICQPIQPGRHFPTVSTEGTNEWKLVILKVIEPFL